MLPFNSFSLPALAAVMTAASLAGVWGVLYWRFGRRATEGAFAALLLFGAVAAAVVFLADNVVASGTASTEAPAAAQWTLAWMRLLDLAGLAAMAAQTHLVLVCCRIAVRRWHLAAAYAAAAAAGALIWTEGFLRVRLEPLSPAATWGHVLPWMPRVGPLVAAYFLAWLGVQVLSQYLLWQTADRARTAGEADVAGIGWLRLGFLASAAGGTTDVLLSGFGYAGMSALPFAIIATAALVTVGLVKQRLPEAGKSILGDPELRLAAEIQQELLPKTRPSIRGFELGGWNRPALITSGDTFDFLELPNGRWLITMGDATGHGMGPALVVAETRALLRATAAHRDNPMDIIREVDRLLSLDLIEGMMMPCFVGLLTPSAARLAYASAGQGPILFFKWQTCELKELPATGPPMGLGLPVQFNQEDDQWTFEPGDLMVLLSDGFFEATNAAGEFFGMDRVKRFLTANPQTPAMEMIAGLMRAVDAFTGGRPQEDDMTMVVLRKL